MAVVSGRIRFAEASDAAALAAIYAPSVEGSAISFEVAAPTAAEMAGRIASTMTTHPWLVMCGEDQAPLGYVYACPHRARAAYQWSVDVAVYIAAGAQRQGIAQRLYRALFKLLAAQGFVQAYAGIALPNAASVALHERLGFTPVGIYRDVGFKLGQWRSVGWWQLRLQPLPQSPGPPLALPQWLAANPGIAEAILRS